MNSLWDYSQNHRTRTSINCPPIRSRSHPALQPQMYNSPVRKSITCKVGKRPQDLPASYFRPDKQNPSSPWTRNMVTESQGSTAILPVFIEGVMSTEKETVAVHLPAIEPNG